MKLRNMIYTVMVLVRFKGSCVTLKMVSFMTRVLGPYSTITKKAEKEAEEIAKTVNDLRDMKELNTGLPAPSQEDLIFHRLINEFMKKIYIKNRFFMDCNLSLRCMSLIWASCLSLLLVELDH